MSEKGEEEDEPSSASTWWGSFYDSAKKKLTETNEFLMRDMKEFTDTVKHDTSRLVASTAASMKDQLNIKVDLEEASQATKVVTQSLTGFLGSVVSHVAPIPPDDDEDDDSTAYVGTYSGVKVISPYQARIFTLQTDPATYCNEPDNLADFEAWVTSFNLDDKREEISILMLDFKEVRSLYTKLVPDAVSHVNFWTRYYYKRNEIDQAERRRAELVQRAEKKESELTWDDEDDFDADSDVIAMMTPASDENSKPISDAVEKSSKTVDSPSTDSSVPETSSDVVGKDAPVITGQNNDTACTELSKVDSKVEVPSGGSSLSPPASTNDAACSEEDTANPSHKELPKNVETPDDTEYVPPASKLPYETENVDTPCEQPARTDKSCANVDTPSDPGAEPRVVKVAAINTESDAVIATLEVESPSNDVIDSDVKPADDTTVKQESVPKESSSGGSSDWEKEFDLDMTEEEIDAALVDDDTNLDDVNIDDWEQWE